MTSAHYVILPLDIDEQASAVAIARLLHDSLMYDLPNEPHESIEDIAHGLPIKTTRKKVFYYAVWDTGKVIAYVELRYDTEQNTHLGDVSINVHPSYRRKGIGTLLFNHIVEKAREVGLRSLNSNTNSEIPASSIFAQRINANITLESQENKLMINEISSNLLDSWQIRPTDDTHRLVFWRIIPDEYLERMADMIMVMNDAPRGDLDAEDRLITPKMIREWDELLMKEGYISMIVAAEHISSGRIDGYTEVEWKSTIPEKVRQCGTAVRSEARGLGLGKWLKAAMIEKVTTNLEGAEYIVASNASVNAAMLGINAALGFKPWRETTNWQFKL